MLRRRRGLSAQCPLDSAEDGLALLVGQVLRFHDFPAQALRDEGPGFGLLLGRYALHLAAWPAERLLDARAAPGDGPASARLKAADRLNVDAGLVGKFLLRHSQAAASRSNYLRGALPASGRAHVQQCAGILGNWQRSVRVP